MHRVLRLKACSAFPYQIRGHPASEQDIRHQRQRNLRRAWTDALVRIGVRSWSLGPGTGRLRFTLGSLEDTSRAAVRCRSGRRISRARAAPVATGRGSAGQNVLSPIQPGVLANASAQQREGVAQVASNPEIIPKGRTTSTRLGLAASGIKVRISSLFREQVPCSLGPPKTGITQLIAYQATARARSSANPFPVRQTC
jgi:hypothetical protein